MSPGDKITVTYLRDGQTKTAEVTLGSQGSPTELSENTQSQGKSNVLDGITVGDLDDASRADLKLPKDIKGVLVTDVAQDSVGYDAGLRKGDVILEMNRKPLANADEAVTEGNNIDKNERVLLHVWTSGGTNEPDAGNGRSQYLVLKPKE